MPTPPMHTHMRAIIIGLELEAWAIVTGTSFLLRTNGSSILKVSYVSWILHSKYPIKSESPNVSWGIRWVLVKTSFLFWIVIENFDVVLFSFHPHLASLLSVCKTICWPHVTFFTILHLMYLSKRLLLCLLIKLRQSWNSLLRLSTSNVSLLVYVMWS